jgi:hypothetical protein
VLSSSEKAYTLALRALKQKDYHTANGYFGRAAPGFGNNREFQLFRETTRLLLDVKDRLSALDEDRLDIEEVFSNGQEEDVPRQDDAERDGQDLPRL